MARRNDEEETPELTGRDASVNEADSGDAGSGASFNGGDRTGLPPVDEEVPESARSFEAAGEAPDIGPDKIVRGFSDGLDDDDRGITARPREDLRPITPDLLPSDDPGAASEEEGAERRAEGEAFPGRSSQDTLTRR